MELSSVVYVVGITITIGLTIATVAEIAALSFLGIAERPKNIWYPLVANLLTFVGIVVVFGLVVVFFATGLLVALDTGYDSAEPLITAAKFAPVLIPAVAFAVRFVLYLLFKFGKSGKAAVYALISTPLSLIGASLITAALYAGISIAGLV